MTFSHLKGAAVTNLFTYIIIAVACRFQNGFTFSCTSPVRHSRWPFLRNAAIASAWRLRYQRLESVPSLRSVHFPQWHFAMHMRHMPVVAVRLFRLGSLCSHQVHHVVLCCTTNRNCRIAAWWLFRRIHNIDWVANCHPLFINACPFKCEALFGSSGWPLLGLRCNSCRPGSVRNCHLCQSVLLVFCSMYYAYCIFFLFGATTCATYARSCTTRPATHSAVCHEHLAPHLAFRPGKTV